MAETAVINVATNSVETKPNVKAEEDIQLNSIYNEEVKHIPTPPTGPGAGIQANDIGSLLEQFLEYEQGSDGDNSSYPDSYFMTPVASPGGSNDDVVLGRLMIVQEKLNQEVEKENDEDEHPSPSSVVEEDKIDNESETVGEKELVVKNGTFNENKTMTTTVSDTENNNVAEKLICKSDGLLRTMNGVHPKGDNIRMADSPKFAKFKKKKLTKEPPLRRTHSGPTTPRCTSPNSEQLTKEEMKKREAKLIEALAITVSKPNKNASVDSTRDVKRAKRKLNTTSGKRKIVEPVPSRLMPVVSKRQRSSQGSTSNANDPRLKGKALSTNDPRLGHKSYCETSNVTQLLNTNFEQIDSTTIETGDDTMVVGVGIVDMTIDHEALSGTIISNNSDEINSTLPPNRNHSTFHIPNSNNEKCTSAETVEVVEQSNSVHQPDELVVEMDIENDPNEDEIITIIKQEPIDYVDIDDTNQQGDFEAQNEVPGTLDSIFTGNNSITDAANENIALTNNLSEGEENLSNISRKDSLSSTNTTTLNSSCKVASKTVKASSVKPPKNYRRTNNLNENDRLVTDEDNSDDERERRISFNKGRRRSTASSFRTTASLRRRYSRSRSRSRSLSRSRSPLDRSRSMSTSPLSKREFYNKTYGKRNRSKGGSRESSDHNSDEENSLDIGNKLSELSNPVPYDIEHERKIQFLVGKTKKEGRYMERRNIYAGGIDRATGKQELIERFRRFGKIEKITMHFRDKGDNYAFIVYDNPDHAMRAIEEGNDDPSFPRLELCFGGRRRFVGGSYVDFDGNNSYLEERTRGNGRCETPEDDFDKLLKMATQNINKRRHDEVSEDEWD